MVHQLLLPQNTLNISIILICNQYCKADEFVWLNALILRTTGSNLKKKIVLDVSFIVVGYRLYY